MLNLVAQMYRQVLYIFSLINLLHVIIITLTSFSYSISIRLLV
jgi:hypothetical protein